jgi:hypothetical protein
MRRRGSGLGISRATQRTARRSIRRARRRRIRMRRRRVLLMGGMVAIAVGATGTAVKMSQQDAQRIEQHTGKKPEDLTEEQLDQVLTELEIDTDELTDAEVASIEAGEAEPAAPTATATPAPSAPGATPDYITELKRLAELRDMGIITAEEFEAKKKQLLGL